jgi:hypothetical protein
MYYHLSEHIYITQFQEEYILLDTQKDKYTICFNQLSNLLEGLFDAPDYNYSPLEMTYINKLLEDNIIVEKDSPYPYYIDKKRHSEGASNVDWRLPLESSQVKDNLLSIRAFFIIIKVNFYIKFKGLFKTIQLIKKTRNHHQTFIIPSDEELNDLAHTINKACRFYPTRIKCLEWAMTFVLLALQKGWKCNLEIGVQNYPFFAHAWVECNGKVVMDSQNLREGLSIILNEPFRKEII